MTRWLLNSKLANSSWSEIEYVSIQAPPCIAYHQRRADDLAVHRRPQGPTSTSCERRLLSVTRQPTSRCPTRNLRFSINGEGKSKSGIKISFYEVPMAAASGGH